MENNDYQYYNFGATPQQEFDRQVTGVWALLSRIVSFLFYYLPLLLLGYIAASHVLKRNDAGLAWLLAVFVFAGLAYAIVLALKNLAQKYRSRGNSLWVLPFVLAVGVTCLLVPILAFEPITQAFQRWHWPAWLAVVIDLLSGCMIYHKYDFLGKRK